VTARACSFLLVVAATLAPTLARAQSCAMCASSFGENDPVQRAFSWSILFLMATPYTIVAVIGGFLYFSHRRGSERRRSAVIDLGSAARLLRGARRTGDNEGDLA
jgi:hypothetical protein